MSRAERDWVDALRAQFPVTGQGAFFDMAYGPLAVYEKKRRRRQGGDG